MNSPFWHYNCASFDPIELINKYALKNQKPEKGFVKNFLGVLISPKYFPGMIEDKVGTVDDIPIPANYHADISEWGAALRAVELSGEKFTMIELGCGWGCWMNNTGKAAKQHNKSVQLIGVEGDEGHIDFAKESLYVNGFDSNEYNLIRGIAAGKNGIALFPKQSLAGNSYGLEPKFNVLQDEMKKLLQMGSWDKLDMIPIQNIVKDHNLIDLLHIDIQGGEVNLVSEAIDDINNKVSYLLIGTHSRQIEGRLFDILLNNDWVLDIERPAILNLSSSPIVTVDGVQGWRNKRFIRRVSISKLYEIKLKNMGVEFLNCGWSQPEPEFVWSDGEIAGLKFYLDEKFLNKDLKITLNVFPFITEKIRQQFFEVLVNGKNVCTGSLASEENIEITVPKYINSVQELEIEIDIPNCDSPKNQGLSNDSRMLGIGLKSIKIDSF